MVFLFTGDLSMKSILTAFRFLTIIPLGKGEDVDPKGMASAMAWFPAVGLVLGLVLAGIDKVFQHYISQRVADIILIGILALITGCLHLDGFADTLDGIFGGRGDRERILAIMKDSHVGAVGVVGIILLLMLKYASLESVNWHYRTGALVIMPAVARWSQVITAFGADFARKHGSLAQPFVEHMEMWHFMVATATAAVAVFVFGGIKGMFILVAAGVFALAAKLYFTKRIGGVTGDTIGAVSEAVEALVLLSFVVAG